MRLKFCLCIVTVFLAWSSIGKQTYHVDDLNYFLNGQETGHPAPPHHVTSLPVKFELDKLKQGHVPS